MYITIVRPLRQLQRDTRPIRRGSMLVADSGQQTGLTAPSLLSPRHGIMMTVLMMIRLCQAG